MNQQVVSWLRTDLLPGLRDLAVSSRWDSTTFEHGIVVGLPPRAPR